MIRLLILASVGAVIGASFIPTDILNYPRSLQSLFGTKRETAKEGKEGRAVCDTAECKLIAKVIKDSIEESVDPCDDFYEYACGKWSTNNPLPENKTEWSLWVMVSDKIRKQVQEIVEAKPRSNDIFAVKLAKKWYRSCMDTDAIEKRGVEPLLSTLWRHGGWPLIMEEGEWDERIYNWQIVDDHFARLLGLNAFHDLRYGTATYEGNDTILIEAPHLPLGLHMLLSYDSEILITDSSDENNESGEGSQEAGSKERGKEKQHEMEENEDKDEDEEENDEEEENDMSTEGNIHKRLGHGRRRANKHRMMGKRVGKKGTKRRTKRDIMKERVLHKIWHRLKKANKHRVHHGAHKLGKLSKHTHLVHGKSSMKRKNHNNKDDEKLRKKKISRRRNGKRLSHGKTRNNKNKTVEKRSSKITMKRRNNEHYRHRKVANHKVHRVGHKMHVARHRKISAANDDENTSNDIDFDNDAESKDDNDSDARSEYYDDTSNEWDENNDIDIDSDEQGDEENEDENDDDEENEEEGDEDENDEEENDDYEDMEDEEAERAMLKEEYREYILNVSMVLSKAREIEVPMETLKRDIDDLIEFSIKLGQLTLKSYDDELVNTTLNDFQESYNSMDSTTRNSKINWIRKVQKLFAEAGVSIEDDVDITITCPEYIKDLHSLLEETPSKTIVNYIHWLFISKAIMASTRELREMAENWSTRKVIPRSTECLQLVEMSNIVGYEYVQRYFSEDVAKTARDMIDDIQKEVEQQIKESTWMDHEIKHFVLDKLVNMRNLVGYPTWYQNSTMVKHYFQGLTVGPSFYENVLNYIRHLKWKSLRRIVEQIDEANELLDPLELNAFFMPTENAISITAADFQSPFFALSRPWYVNFGIIGYVMGHEVNHGFDDSGHLYDHEGNVMEWLSAMADAYDKRAECFVDQFNKYSIVKETNYTIENYGNQTAGENIADTMGLQAVFRAYKRRERECSEPDPALPGLEKFSNDQTFFLSFANLWCETVDPASVISLAKYDVHSPSRLRVIGSVSNSEDFAKAFNCPTGSPMNPKRKCNIWI